MILRGLAAEWKPCQWTFESLAARIGARPIPVVRLHDGLLGYGKYSGMDYDKQPFDEVVRHIANVDRPDWFLQLNPDEHLRELLLDLPTSEYDQSASWRDRIITIAGVGTTTPIHRELPDNLFTVFCGKKEVVLFPPSDSRHLYAFGPFSGVPHFSQVDPRQHDTANYPRLHSSKPYHCRLQAGDALLIPRGWWHAVQTTEPSIALGSWWASGAFALLPIAATLYKRIFRLRT